jgi:hypothetical protein
MIIRSRKEIQKKLREFSETIKTIFNEYILNPDKKKYISKGSRPTIKIKQNKNPKVMKKQNNYSYRNKTTQLISFKRLRKNKRKT